MINLLTFFVCLFVTFSSSAAITQAGPVIGSTSSGFQVGYSNSLVGNQAVRLYEYSSELDRLLARDFVKISVAEGVTGEFAATRMATAAAVAAGLGAIVAVNAPVIIAGTTALGIWEYAGCKISGGSIQCDYGEQKQQVSEDVWCVTNTDFSGGPYCQVSASAAANQALQSLGHPECWTGSQFGYGTASYTLGTREIRSGYGDSFSTTGVCSNPNTSTAISGPIIKVGFFTGNVSYRCRELSSGAEVIPRSDGLCPTGRYEQADATRTPSHLENNKVIKPSNIVSVADAVVKAGGKINPDTNTPTITGPQSLNGPSRTTTGTNADGSTWTRLESPGYSFSYPPTGGRVDVKNTNTTETTTRDQNGNPTGTETKTEESEKPVEETKDLCQLNPGILACIKLGDVPADVVPSVTRDVTLSPEAIALPSGCPSPIPLPNGQQISYVAACQVADGVRPLVIAMGVLAAGLICIAAIRGS